jgi:hypothetical protein
LDPSLDQKQANLNNKKTKAKYRNGQMQSSESSDSPKKVVGESVNRSEGG